MEPSGKEYQLNAAENKLIVSLIAAKKQAESNLNHAFMALLAAHDIATGDLVVTSPDGFSIRERPVTAKEEV